MCPKFYYLGDTLGAGGDVLSGVPRINLGWVHRVRYELTAMSVSGENAAWQG